MVSTWPSLLQAEQSKLSQPFFLGEKVGSPPANFVAHLWTCSGSSMSFLCWRCKNCTSTVHSTPAWVQKGRVEQEDPISWPAGHAALDTAQDAVGFLGCEHTLTCRLFFIKHHPQILLRRVCGPSRVLCPWLWRWAAAVGALEVAALWRGCPAGGGARPGFAATATATRPVRSAATTAATAGPRCRSAQAERSLRGPACLPSSVRRLSCLSLSCVQNRWYRGKAVKHLQPDYSFFLSRCTRFAALLP